MSNRITKSPPIRFVGFTDSWEQLKLGDMLEERNEQIPENEQYPLMSFVQGTGVTPKGDRYDRSFLVKDDKKKYKKTEMGDFIYSSNNLETGSIGINKTGKAVISPVYSIFASKNELESQFVGILSTRKDFINKMLYFRQGVVYGQWRIHESDFLNIKIVGPSLDEQIKIIELFYRIDETITLQQRQYDKLVILKKSMLEKMFPKDGVSVPEIRFVGFNDAWEQRKLKDVAYYIRGSFPQPYTNPDFYDEENGKPFVQVADIGFDLRLNPDTKAHISKIAEPKSRFVEAGKVVVALQGSIEKSIGRTAITQYDAYFDRTILIFEEYKFPMDKQYFAQVIKKLFEIEKERAWGATISTITKEHLNDFIIGVPKIEEQQKIGLFFHNLDNLITLHQGELNTLRNLKKSLIQQMFV